LKVGENLFHAGAAAAFKQHEIAFTQHFAQMSGAGGVIREMAGVKAFGGRGDPFGLVSTDGAECGEIE
jgi:hypothetical protein